MSTRLSVGATVVALVVAVAAVFGGPSGALIALLVSICLLSVAVAARLVLGNDVRARIRPKNGGTRYGARGGRNP